MTDLNKIAEKIQHLLDKTVANGATEAEAQQALLAAQKLIAKYNIDMNKLNPGQKTECSLEVSKIKDDSRVRRIAVILADSFACKCLIHRGYIAFFGYKVNAEASATAMNYIKSVLEAGMRRECISQGFNSTHEKGASLVYNAYALGFIDGLKKAMDAQTVALAVVVPEEVNTALKEMFPVLGQKKSQSMRYGRGQMRAYENGHYDGNTAMARRSLDT